MKTRHLALASALVITASAALALPPFIKDMDGVYKLGPALKKADCSICHIGKTPKLNPYGADLKKAMTELKTKKVTADALKKIEDLDSDKDGAKNLAEIKGDALPGDEKSKPQ